MDNNTMSGSREGDDVVEEICGLLESISQLGEYRRCFRRECHGLARRIILEEIKDAQEDDSVLPDHAVRFLVTLKDAVLFGEKLLKTCHAGRKIFLLNMMRFHRAHDVLCKALLGVPYDELGISDEVKEQVELLRVQLARARRGTDTQDMELAMDLMAVFSEDNEHNLDRAIVERLAKKLELSTVDDLMAKTIAVKNIVKERGGEYGESVEQIIDLLNKLKQVKSLM